MTPVSNDLKKNRSYASIAIAFAVLVTVASGALYGRMSKQWGVEQDFEKATVVLSDLPKQFGKWHLEGEHELGNSAMELLQCQAFIHHSYRNSDTGRVVTIAVMVGPGAKMSIHVPEICFEAKNYTLIQDRERVQIESEDGDDELWSVAFQLNDVSEQRLNVYYGWRADRNWVAPTMPRWSVAGTPALFKLQLTEQIPASIDSGEGGAIDFLEAFLPVLNARLNKSANSRS